MIEIIQSKNEEEKEKYLCPKCENDTFRVYKIYRYIKIEVKRVMLKEIELECVNCGYKFKIL